MLASRQQNTEAILAMPPQLWRAIEAISLVLNIDANLIRSPLQGADSA